MTPTLATIDVKNLRLRTYIGFNPDERAKQQDVVINLQIRHRISPSAFDDEVDAALVAPFPESLGSRKNLLIETAVGT